VTVRVSPVALYRFRSRPGEQPESSVTSRRQMTARIIDLTRIRRKFVFKGVKFYVYHGRVEGHDEGKHRASIYQRPPGTTSPQIEGQAHPWPAVASCEGWRLRVIGSGNRRGCEKRSRAREKYLVSPCKGSDRGGQFSGPNCNFRGLWKIAADRGRR